MPRIQSCSIRAAAIAGLDCCMNSAARSRRRSESSPETATARSCTGLLRLRSLDRSQGRRKATTSPCRDPGLRLLPARCRRAVAEKWPCPDRGSATHRRSRRDHALAVRWPYHGYRAVRSVPPRQLASTAARPPRRGAAVLTRRRRTATARSCTRLLRLRSHDRSQRRRKPTTSPCREPRTAFTPPHRPAVAEERPCPDRGLATSPPVSTCHALAVRWPCRGYRADRSVPPR